MLSPKTLSKQVWLFVFAMHHYLNQIEEARGMGISVVSESRLMNDELRSAKFQLLFAPVEKVINNHFLKNLKQNDSALHRDLAAVVEHKCPSPRPFLSHLQPPETG